MHNPLGDTGITPKLKQWLQDHPFWEAETRQDKLDQFIFAVFPFFVALFGLLAVAMFFVYWIDDLTVGHLLYSLCVWYTLCFVILGIPTVFLSDHSIIKIRYIATGLSLIAILIGLLFWSVFNPDNGDLYEFMSGFYWFISYLGVDINIYTTVIGVLVILHISVLVSYGVLAVVIAYFRRNYHRILLSLEKNDESRLCRAARKYFQIPYIIDVDEVVLEPEVDDKVFQMNVFKRMFGYEVIAGLIIASYLFLNPVFLKTIDFGEMMAIIMLITPFISAIVVPISIVRSLGATAHSKGNRPFVIWKGMKEKFFHPAFYVALFLTLLWISIYTQMDGLRIIAHYAGYLVFLIFLSGIVSFVYVNVFYIPLKNGIIRNFQQRRTAQKEKSESKE